jgi:ubiquitin-like 1-activating enzyme E1 B
LQPVHCIVWAKDLLLGRLFGDESLARDLIVHSTNETEASSTEDTEFFNLKDGETHESYAKRIFDGVFGLNIVVALKNESTWRTRQRPRPLYLRDISGVELQQENASNSQNGTNEGSEHVVSAARILGLSNPQDVWSVTDNARIFLQAIVLFHEERKKVRADQILHEFL